MIIAESQTPILPLYPLHNHHLPLINLPSHPALLQMQSSKSSYLASLANAQSVALKPSQTRSDFLVKLHTHREAFPGIRPEVTSDAVKGIKSLLRSDELQSNSVHS